MTAGLIRARRSPCFTPEAGGAAGEVGPRTRMRSMKSLGAPLIGPGRSVRNPTNPLLGFRRSQRICWVAAYMFRDDPVLEYAFHVLADCRSLRRSWPTSYISFWIGIGSNPKSVSLRSAPWI